MQSIPRALALCAPFVAALALAAAASAGGPSLGAMLDAPLGATEPLTEAAITELAGDGPAADATSPGVAVSVNGGAGAAPAAAPAPARPADTRVWQELPPAGR
jgi:hypothetical protein